MRIIEVKGVSHVAYDIAGKAPGAIEWERGGTAGGLAFARLIQI